MAEEVKIKNRKKLRKERVHVIFFSFLSVTLGQSSEVSESAVTVETFFYKKKKALLSTIKNEYVVIFNGIPHWCV